MKNKRSVLYISYDCITEPLTHSQVLPYLKRLSHTYEIRLMTFNKKRVPREELASLARRYGLAGIIALTYHKKPTVPATAYDIVRGFLAAAYAVRRYGISFVHARSYVAGMIAFGLRRILGTPYIFDIRGLLADERRDSGDWSERSLAYRAAKKSERAMLRAAGSIVVLAERGVEILDRIAGGGRDIRGRISVIPTCVDTDLFRRESASDGGGRGMRIAYLGSVGTWYMLPEMARFFKVLTEEVPGSKALFVTRSDPSMIGQALAREGLREEDADIEPAAYEDVPRSIARADATVFFIRPSYSKRVSCPTKFGESLSMGMPVVANAGIGDIDGYITRHRVGVVVTGFTDEDYRRAIRSLCSLLGEGEALRGRCRALAEREFSLATGVARYDAIYGSMV